MTTPEQPRLGPTGERPMANHVAAADAPITFVQASHYHKGRLKPVRLIVIHDMEAPEKAATAEAVARYLQTTTRDASAHLCVDNDSAVQCVKDEDTAWAAPGANADGFHVEHAGYAAQTVSDWLDPYGKQMLAISAREVASRCRKWGIPVRRLTVAQVRDGQSKGICGHIDVTKAFPELHGSHTDPGAGFPWSYYLALVRAELNEAPHPDRDPTRPPAKPHALVVDGNLGALTVARLQACLNAWGARPRLKTDGDLGAKTWMAAQRWLQVTPADGAPDPTTVRALQRRVGLDGAAVDGRVGPVTVKALQRYLNRH